MRRFMLIPWKPSPYMLYIVFVKFELRVMLSLFMDLDDLDDLDVNKLSMYNKIILSYPT